MIRDAKVTFVLFDSIRMGYLLACHRVHHIARFCKAHFTSEVRAFQTALNLIARPSLAR